VLVEFAEALEPLADWEAIKAMMPYGSDLWPKVRDVISRFEVKTAPTPISGFRTGE